MFKVLRLTVPAALIVAVFSACGGAAAPTTRPTGTAGQPTATAGQSTAASGDVVTAAICRNLDSLTNVDYAFGKPFSVVQNLDAASKALTLQHLTQFAQTAPVELLPAAQALVELWTDLSTDPSSVSESDPRWQQATDSINAWKAAHC